MSPKDMSASDPPILSDFNYPIWRAQVTAYLQRKGLYRRLLRCKDDHERAEKHVKTETNEKTTNDNSDIEDDQYYRLLGSISTFLPQRWLTRAEDLEDPWLLWEEIADHHAAILPQRTELLQSQIASFVWKGTDITNNLERFRNIKDQFVACGGQMSDNQLLLAFVRHMPTKYSTIRQHCQLNYTMDFEATMVQLCTVHTEEQIAQQRHSATHQATALSTRDNTEFCHYCKRKGHNTEDCRRRKRHAAKRNQNGQNGGTRQPPRNNNGDHRTEPSKPRVSFATTNDKPIALSARAPTTEHYKSIWIADSGASTHMCHTSQSTGQISTMKHPQTITIANGDQVPIHGMADIPHENIVLKDTLVSDALHHNLLSISKLDEHGYTTVFSGGKMKVLPTASLNATPVLTGTMRNGLYEIQELSINAPNQPSVACTSTATTDDLNLHRAMGHINVEAMMKTLRLHSHDTRTIKPIDCDDCQQSKATRTRIATRSTTRIATNSPGDLIHADLCGPITPSTIQGNQYVLSLIDDHSRFAHVFPLRQKSDALKHIRDVNQLYRTRTGRAIRIIRTDNGGEFRNNALSDYCLKHGITQQFTHAHRSQENSVAERWNRKLMDNVRAQLLHSGAPKQLWADVAVTTARISNNTYHRSINDIPINRIFAPDARIPKFVPFGCRAFVLGNPTSKLDQRAHPGIMIGYSPQNTKGYKIRLDDGTVVISRDVQFRPHSFPLKKANCATTDTDAGSDDDDDDATPSASDDPNGSEISAPTNRILGSDDDHPTAPDASDISRSEINATSNDSTAPRRSSRPPQPRQFSVPDVVCP